MFALSRPKRSFSESGTHAALARANLGLARARRHVSERERYYSPSDPHAPVSLIPLSFRRGSTSSSSSSSPSSPAQTSGTTETSSTTSYVQVHVPNAPAWPVMTTLPSPPPRPQHSTRVSPAHQPASASCRKANSSDGVTCVICLDSAERDTELCFLVCGHSFHVPCVDAWLDNSAKCPLCGTDAF